jgi:carboxynorspermidine decarboxylase
MTSQPLATPYYLIDEARLLANLQIIERVRARSGAKVVLALKCFSTWNVFGLMSRFMDGTTSSSLYEARLGHEEFGGEVHAYSVAFTADEVLAVSQFADKVIFNSISQLEAHAGRAAGVQLGLRVNPGLSHSHFDLADPARPNSRLGVSDDAALAAAAGQVDGLMFHFNCENDDLDGLSRSIDTIGRRYGAILDDVDWVSLGGGISFTGPDYPLDRFCDVLAGFCERVGVQVYLEPGEATITSCAQLVTTVVDVVHNEIDVAIVDASVEAHMLDHLIYSTSPGLVAPAPGHHRTAIAGRTCLAGDVFGEYSVAAPIVVGDEVRFADAAGYTMVKKSWFNGLVMPSIAVRHLDGTTELVRAFDYTDYKGSLS